ncbi:uncharacterized protein E0L32_011501 [Thyridium curvatum]|uniref:Palmitoyltransferase n=1 Tax=Thyridium curvatum TaxID=1093900 RepID=A0A507B922_9PEZI|nr:uncharacterized protein E0L32_011501 [Thyridium curvatum]TPX18822.1 hypothetical protein E0L32_011501 [Thyridium curvatum]
MGPLAKIAAVVLAISFMTFVAFFGRLPALRRTPVAWLYRLIWVYIPRAVMDLDQKLTSGRLTSSLSRFGTFIMYDKHPTVLIFFVLLLSVSQYIAVPLAWPLISAVQKLTLSMAVFFPYLFTYLAAFTDPGIIDPSNHAYHMSQYPYDFTLFYPGTDCRTCHLLKPARSKHCSVCKRCISRMDHHCVFINNCVGANNARWFLLCLFSTAVLTSYGGALGMSLVIERAVARNPTWSMLPWRAVLSDGSPMSWSAWLLAWSWGLHERINIGAVSLLALLTSPLVWGLLGYNMWNVYTGVTTNESMKWSDWKDEMEDGFAYKRKMGPDHPKDPRVEPMWTRWPVEADQVLVRTENGRPPHPSLKLEGSGEWEQVWRLKDVENLYDLGFWDNLIDVMVPGHCFNDSDMPAVERRGRSKATEAPVS